MTAADTGQLGTGRHKLRVAQLSADGWCDMFILKLAIVTCAIYMGITLLLFFGILALVHLKGGVFYSLNWRTFGLLFGLIWLASFTVARRIVISRFAAG